MYKFICSVIFIAMLLVTAAAAHAQVCARVVIQIEQELTLEREGFEARLGVSNGQPAPLDDFSVVLKFSDESGNPVIASTDAHPDTNGKFYYRIQTGTTAVTSVAAGETAKLTYLIVPAPGAAGSNATGNLYYVGATVKYKVNGIEQTVEVAPDFIRVHPMPALQLQYFLPGDVYGDDPTTPAIKEPVVPFPLGVRATNHSPFATAFKLKIQSGQPEIIDNQLGLLIDFRIIGCEVNAAPVEPSLLANFGDLGPQRSSMASWAMTSTLSGKFVKFSAEITHAPELGGNLTSLIPSDAISTHRLVGRVLVDLPGRDLVPDFLGTETMAGEYNSVQLYESDNDQVSEPVDFYGSTSGAVNLTPEGSNYRVSIDTVSAKMFIVHSSPIAADKTVRAVRSDGKNIPLQNCWVSKKKNDQREWTYFVNLFDTDKQANQTYVLTFSDPTTANRPPVLTILGGIKFQVLPNTALSIQATAVDPDGFIPVLTTGDLPDGAHFADAKNGWGAMVWTPNESQLGTYRIQFRASDGADSDSKVAIVSVVQSLTGGFAEWQKRFWPDITDPAIIGPQADPDRDQLSNLLEYALDGDPTSPDESILPEIGVSQVGTDQYLTLTFRKRTDDPTLVYEVIGADSLFAPASSWTVQTQVVPVSQADLPPAMERVQIRDNVPIGLSLSHRYLRLRVTQGSTP